MKFKLFICFILLWIIFNKASTEYDVSGISFEWTAAINLSRVTIASPPLDFHNESNINIGDLLNDGEEAWIGYFQTDVSFEYFGCLWINDTAPTMTLSRRWNTPGICFSVCDNISKNVFGLNKNKCFCLDYISSFDIHHTGCDNGTNINWVAGGGDQYMSLYRKIDIDEAVDHNDSSSKCLAFSGKREMWWKECSENYTNVCIKDRKSMPVNDSNGQWYFPWTRYVERCFAYNCTPVSYNDTDNIVMPFENETSESWTNVIRDKAIFSYRDYVNDNKSKEYAYVRKENEHEVLWFTNNHSLLFQMLYIQTTDHSITETTTTTKTVSVSNGAEEPVKDTKNNHLDTSSVPDNILITVLLLIFVVVMVTIIILIVKRRYKIHILCLRKSTPDESTCKQPRVQSNDYETLEDFPHCEMNEQGVYNKHDTDFVDGEPADTNFGHRNECEFDSQNIDVSIDIEDNKDVYDILKSNLDRANKNKVGNTYDTMETVAKKLKDQCNISGMDLKINYDVMFDDKNTYDHLNSTPTKSRKTDNVYGIPNDFKGDNADMRTNQENEHSEDS